MNPMMLSFSLALDLMDATNAGLNAKLPPLLSVLQSSVTFIGSAILLNSAETAILHRELAEMKAVMNTRMIRESGKRKI